MQQKLLSRPSLDRLTPEERSKIKKLWKKPKATVWRIAQQLKLEPWRVYHIVRDL